MPLIDIKNLSKSYGGRRVLKDLSLEINEGDHLYIVGENGSGKTTLMKLMLGLLYADKGEIRFSGFGKSEIGYLPQSAEIQRDFPACVWEVVLSGTLSRKRLLPFYSKSDRERAKAALKKLNIENLSRQPLCELSGGQRQKVLLARALCATKKVLLLDEPLTALDPASAVEFYSLMDELRHDGITVIIISHDVSCAVHYGNKILHLGNEGYFFGTTSEYVHSPIGKEMLKGGHCHE